MSKVKVCFANLQPEFIDADIVKGWEPERETTMGGTTFLKIDGTYVSIETKEYHKIKSNDGSNNSN